MLNTVVKLTDELGIFSNLVIVEEGLRLTTGLEAFGMRVVLVPTILEEGEIILVAYVVDGVNSSGLKEVEGEVDGMECQ